MGDSAQIITAESFPLLPLNSVVNVNEMWQPAQGSASCVALILTRNSDPEHCASLEQDLISGGIQQGNTRRRSRVCVCFSNLN